MGSDGTKAFHHRNGAVVWLLLFFSASVHAGTADTPYGWRNVVVGDGGFIPAIVFSRAEPGLAYARCDIGGLYRWDARRAEWLALQDAMNEGNYFGIESVAPDPLDADVVYAAAGMYRRDPAAILRSRDRGATWDVFPVHFRMGGNEDGRGLGERLAIDPNQTTTLYYGTRHDGLQRSVDAGATWQRIDSFPHQGLGVPERGQPTYGGLSFIVVDPSSGSPGKRSQTMFVGIADPGEHHVYRSDDGGETWTAIAGQPQRLLLPAQAQLDGRGRLYISYGNGIGPNGVTDGAVFRYDTRGGAWTDITPPRGNQAREGGYMGLSLDRQHKGTLVVATMNRWNRGDTIWRSVDAGRRWHDLRGGSRHDVGATPFLLWGERTADFGWWIAGIAIDPFNSNFLAYTTGATIYATRELGKSARDEALTWRPWVNGIEHTAVITLTSPTAGVPLLSGFGDISGFAHDDLRASPTTQFKNPIFGNTNTIDYAATAPNIVVRSGTPHGGPGETTLAYSADGGHSWTPLPSPQFQDTAMQTRMSRGDFAISTSADGAAFVVSAATPWVTLDRGATWTQAQGAPAWARTVADRARPLTFYALDYAHSSIFVSTDGGKQFISQSTTGLPDDIDAEQPMNREAPWPLVTAPGRAGELWFVAHGQLFHSTDAGKSFARRSTNLHVEMLSLGKSAPGRETPTLFAIGRQGDLRAIWRSDDAAQTWVRVNDSQHEWGRRFRVIAADPRVYGRVYVGTDGRGILYGEPVNLSKTPDSSG